MPDNDKPDPHGLTPLEILERFKQVDISTGMNALLHVLKDELREYFPSTKVSPERENDILRGYKLIADIPLSGPVPIEEKYWTWTGRKRRVAGQRTHEERVLVYASVYFSNSNVRSVEVRVNDKRVITACESLASELGMKTFIKLNGNISGGY
jgi:predicted NAD/FAD-dependent oxidoreductase